MAAGVVSYVLARSSPAYQGGGVWVHPGAPVAEWGDGPMVLEVQVMNISRVEHINFTGTWSGVGWEILPGCTETVAPPYPAGDIYRCMFDPQAAGVPALTDMTLSFDVYGTAATRRRSTCLPTARIKCHGAGGAYTTRLPARALAGRFPPRDPVDAGHTSLGVEAWETARPRWPCLQPPGSPGHGALHARLELQETPDIADVSEFRLHILIQGQTSIRSQLCGEDMWPSPGTCPPGGPGC